MKKICSITLIFSLGLLATLLFGCEKQGVNNKHISTNTEPVMYYKMVPVKIVRIFNKGNYMNKRYYASIEIESKKYNLHETFTLHGDLMYADDYLKEIFNGEIKEGDTINCEMLSWVQNKKVIRRELNQLVNE